MSPEIYKKAEEVAEKIKTAQRELNDISKWNTDPKNDYGIWSVRNKNGSAVNIPDEAKEIVLNIVKAHYQSKLHKLKKELADL